MKVYIIVAFDYDNLDEGSGVINASLDKEFVDCFGGSDTAHNSFTNLQKAINEKLKRRIEHASNQDLFN